MVTVVGTPMASDFRNAVQNADLGIGGNQCELAANGFGRNGVVVEIEADIDGLG